MDRRKYGRSRVGDLWIWEEGLDATWYPHRTRFLLHGRRAIQIGVYKFILGLPIKGTQMGLNCIRTHG